MNKNIYIEFNYTVNFKNRKRGFVFSQYKESLNKGVFALYGSIESLFTRRGTVFLISLKSSFYYCRLDVDRSTKRPEFSRTEPRWSAAAFLSPKVCYASFPAGEYNP